MYYYSLEVFFSFKSIILLCRFSMENLKNGFGNKNTSFAIFVRNIYIEFQIKIDIPNLLDERVPVRDMIFCLTHPNLARIIDKGVTIVDSETLVQTDIE